MTPEHTWVAAAVALGGVVYLGTRTKRSKSKRTHTPQRSTPQIPHNDVEFGPTQFPPTRADTDWHRLRTLAAIAEHETSIEFLYSYLLATAHTESEGRSSAINTTSDAKPAFDLFCTDSNFGRRYSANPWRPQSCDPSAPGTARWAYSGGWFQLMPATALATADRRGHNHDPARVFDPPFAVAYAVDLAQRLARNYRAKTWGDVRAGWALPRWAKPSSTAVGKARVIGNLRESAATLGALGVAPDIATRPVHISDYPGFTHVLHALLNAEGRIAPEPPRLASSELEPAASGRWTSARWRYPDLFVTAA